MNLINELKCKTDKEIEDKWRDNDKSREIKTIAKLIPRL